MSSCAGLFGGPDGAGFAPIKRGGNERGQTLSSWLTGAFAPALKSGFRGAGSTASDPADNSGLFGFERLARQYCARLAARGRATLIRCANLQRPAERHGRLGTGCPPRPIGIHASHGMAATHRWRAWCARRAAQLGSIASALQSAWRTERCDTRSDETRSARIKRTSLRASLCEHALRQRLLPAGAARRAAPEIRSFRLRALP